MSSPQRRPIRDILADVNDLSDAVLAQVRSVAAGGGRRSELERLVLQGLESANEGAEQLGFELESARSSRQDVDWIVEALALVEQKVAFFQGCTMRRSAGQMGQEEEAGSHAAEAERLAAQASSMGGIFELVEAYKATEALEQRIVGLRGSAKAGGSSPEPRVLDLPRARVLAARRVIGAAVRALDDDEDDLEDDT